MLQTKAKNVIQAAESKLKDTWQIFDEIKNHNQVKVLKAFQEAGVQNSHYTWVTGYGYDDLGKDKLGELYAHYFNAEAALVRPQLVSGTHAITCAVFGNLNAGDRLVCIGEPYDTLQTVYKKLSKKYNVDYQIIRHPEELAKQARSGSSSSNDSGSLRSDCVLPQDDASCLISIQRSRGYEWRDSYDLTKIEQLIKQIREINPRAKIFVDNCYGEFTQTQEPTDLGADLIAGSLIKNPGGGIVAAGGYVVGKQEFVEAAAEQLTAPGIGMHGGAMFDQTRLMMQGFFMAPLIVSEALKGMSLAACVFEELGYETIPSYDSKRNDIIQAIKFKDRDKLIKLCAVVQKNSPMNSMFSPIPSPISGYEDEIIMASGSFVEGSSIELSCDGPLREPFIGYLQGGLSYAHTRYVLEKIIEEL